MGFGNPGANGGGGLASTDLDTSLELKTILTDETGSGAAVFATAPTLSQPTAPGAGAGSEAWGASAVAAGAAGTSLGNAASAGSTDSVALGETATASVGTGNIAIGSDSAASGSTGAIAIGDGAAASGTSAISLGLSSVASATDCIAIGEQASATTGTGNISLGSDASSTGTAGCISIGDGADCNASGVSAIAIGFSPNATATAAIAIGRNAQATAADAIAIGDAANVGGATSVAIGDAATTSTYTNALAIGASATATANNDGQIGTSAQPYNLKTYGTHRMNTQAMTAGTMTGTVTAEVRQVIHQFSWTNSMVTALGATTSGNVAICTLPAKTVVTNAYVVITGAAAGPASVTVSVGRTGASYIDYIVASDAKAAANTVYGDGSAERGANLTGYDLASYTGTTVVNAQFVSVGANLDTVTASTGHVYLETMVLP